MDDDQRFETEIRIQCLGLASNPSEPDFCKSTSEILGRAADFAKFVFGESDDKEQPKPETAP